MENGKMLSLHFVSANQMRIQTQHFECDDFTIYIKVKIHLYLQLSCIYNLAKWNNFYLNST